MKARMKFVAAAAMLFSTLAVGAVAQDRRDLRVADEVGRAVRQYAQYTIFDDVSGRPSPGLEAYAHRLNLEVAWPMTLVEQVALTASTTDSSAGRVASVS